MDEEQLLAQIAAAEAQQAMRKTKSRRLSVSRRRSSISSLGGQLGQRIRRSSISVDNRLSSRQLAEKVDKEKAEMESRIFDAMRSEGLVEEADRAEADANIAAMQTAEDRRIAEIAMANQSLAERAKVKAAQVGMKMSEAASSATAKLEAAAKDAKTLENSAMQQRRLAAEKAELTEKIQGHLRATGLDHLAAQVGIPRDQAQPHLNMAGSDHRVNTTTVNTDDETAVVAAIHQAEEAQKLVKAVVC